MSLKERGNVEDVEVLLIDLDVAHQPLKAVGPDADHESTGRGFFDRGDDVGERAVRETGRCGRARRRSCSCRGCWETCPAGSPAPTGGGPAIGRGQCAGAPGGRRRGGAGTSTDGIVFSRRAERIVRPNGDRPGTFGSAVVPGACAGGAAQARAAGPRPSPGLASAPATLPPSAASSSRHKACPWAARFTISILICLPCFGSFMK